MIYLLTEAELKELTPVAKGIEASDLVGAVRLAQETDILPNIGQPLYDELVEQVAASAVTPANEALLLRIKPWLAWTAFRYVRQNLWARTVTAGVTHTSAPQYNQVSKAVLDWADDTHKARSQQYKLVALEFLAKNMADYPLYAPQVPPKNNLGFTVV